MFRKGKTRWRPLHIKNYFPSNLTLLTTYTSLFCVCANLPTSALSSLQTSSNNQSIIIAKNANLLSQVDLLPPQILPQKTNHENLTIFELVILSQLQTFVKHSLFLGSLQDESQQSENNDDDRSGGGGENNRPSFWLSTSSLTNLLDSSQWSLHKAKRKIKKAINLRVKNKRQIYSAEGNKMKMNEWLLRNKNLRDYFHLEIQGSDKEGCPIVIAPFGQWRTMRSYLEKTKNITEMHINLQTYFNLVISEITNEIMYSPFNCSQFTLICDMKSYSENHNSGLKYFIDFVRKFDRMYPGLLKIAYFINSPVKWLKIKNSYGKIVPWDLKRKSFVYGEDKAVWKAALLWNIDRGQLAPRFGGNNIFFAE